MRETHKVREGKKEKPKRNKKEDDKLAGRPFEFFFSFNVLSFSLSGPSLFAFLKGGGGLPRYVLPSFASCSNFLFSSHLGGNAGAARSPVLRTTATQVGV